MQKETASALRLGAEKKRQRPSPRSPPPKRAARDPRLQAPELAAGAAVGPGHGQLLQLRLSEAQ